MSNSSSTNTRGSSGLLLRVTRQDGQTQELYLADGLTIGRSPANSIDLAGDDAVTRTHHARVELAGNSELQLRCLDSDAFILTGAGRVRDLRLLPGVRFQIGGASLECVQGVRPLPGSQSILPHCPYCSAEQAHAESSAPFKCLACERPILPLRGIPGLAKTVFVPAMVGEFRVTGFVARGGMGIVLRGERAADNGPVAIKLLLPDRSVNRKAAERFKQEVVAMRKIRHPNVVSLLSYGREGQFNFIVMEWIEGRTLQSLVKEWAKSGSYAPFERVVRWTTQICSGLQAIHIAGIVHRDIKPSNLLVSDDDRIRIGDLGIARAIGDSAAEVTTTGELPGTSEYMAPEQRSAPDSVDGRADLYALGVTIYELLTGERPTGSWVPASRANSTVPAWFDAIVARLLSRAPAARYANAGELLIALQTQNGQSIAAQTAERISVDVQDAKFGVTIDIVAIERCRELARRRAWVFVVSSLVLFIVMFGTMTSNQSPGPIANFLIVYSYRYALLFWTVAGGHFATYKGRTPLWGIPFALSWIVVALLPDLSERQLETLRKGDRTSTKETWSDPNYPSLFWWSVLPAGFELFAPLAMILAIADWLRQLHEGRRSDWSVFASIWSLYCVVMLAVGIVNASGSPSDVSPPFTTGTSDGRYLLDVPAGWDTSEEVAKQVPRACLALETTSLDACLIMVHQKKGDFVSFDNCVSNVRHMSSDVAENGSLTDAEKCTINGWPGCQFAYQANSKGIRFVYLVTVFETANDFCCISAWAPPSLMPSIRPDVDQMVRSVRSQ